ncbi:hypothetical protein DFQ26_002091 [Actinomortierella ambigua]|nr:hypothetical protein DFQ26_002091 [Actinomortierella ambigua]
MQSMERLNVGQDEEEVEDEDGEEEEEVEFIGWDEVIFHTPTRPRVIRSMVSASKPDNGRLQQNLKAMADLEDGDIEYDDDDLETCQVGSSSSRGA